LDFVVGHANRAGRGKKVRMNDNNRLVIGGLDFVDPEKKNRSLSTPNMVAD